VGLAVGPPLVFAVALKAFDGSLRHTLYRSAVEVLYLPLDSRRRERGKGVIEVFGHRLGQAIASVLIVILVGLGVTQAQFGLVLLLPTGLWLVAILSTRRQYVDQFRARLRQGVIDTRLELEALDLHSLEALLNALNSEHDEEVLAAIDVFHTHGREDLIPVLVLYHPKKEVKVRALEAFAEASDRRFVPLARRMLGDEDPDVRAAALRALTAVEPNRALLEEKLDLDASIVRATALVGLLSIDPQTSGHQLEKWIADGNARTLHSLARAIRHERGAVFHEALLELIDSQDAEVKLETLRAMESNPDPRYVPKLLALLARSDFRESTRQALVAIGRPALEALDDALQDPQTPEKVRRRIPHTIARFEPQDAGAIVMRHLDAGHEGGVRFQILRALGRLQASHPSLRLDEARLTEQLLDQLRRAAKLSLWRASIEGDERSASPDGELLVVALHDKEHAALERAISVIGLQHLEESFALVWRGLRSDNRRLRAAGIEVIEATVEGPAREALLWLVDDGESLARRSRLAAAALDHEDRLPSYEEAVREMMQDESEVIRGVAAHHAAELEIGDEAAETQEVPSLA